MKTKIFTFLVCILFTAAYIYPQLKIDDKTSLNNLKSNLQFLASDELEGRETGTRGEKLAALFIAAEMQKYGLKPYGDNGTYFQNIKLVSGGYDLTSKIQILSAAGSVISELKMPDDFLSATRQTCDPSFQNISVPIVFAGFGITAPEFKYDDYKDIDVKGKVVLLLPDEPYSEDNAFFNGNKTTGYSNANTKINNAMIHGASGILFFPESWRAKFWDTFKKNATRVSFAPERTDLRNVKNIPALILNEPAAQKLFDGEVLSYGKVSEGLSQKTDFKSFTFNKSIKFNLVDNTQTNMAMNVVGLIEGTDPKLKNEFVLLSGHFDHVGTRNGVVYNGADDDGTGTVSVLEVARIIKENKLNKRSVIALCVTGEEKGLWGSEYASNNSSFITNTVADINIDMTGREAPDSIHVIGSNTLSTEYYNLIKDVNNKTVKMGFNYKYDDPKDPQRFFYRSDHYNFALKGIPIVFFFDDMRKDYHQATDDVDKINFDKVLKVVKLSANIALRVANLDHKILVDKKLAVQGRRD